MERVPQIAIHYREMMSRGVRLWFGLGLRSRSWCYVCDLIRCLLFLCCINTHCFFGVCVADFYSLEESMGLMWCWVSLIPLARVLLAVGCCNTSERLMRLQLCSFKRMYISCISMIYARVLIVQSNTATSVVMVQSNSVNSF